jgi:hypothetical protein
MRTPAFLIDRSLWVVGANARAEKLVEGRRSPARISGGRLHLRCPVAHGEMDTLVASFFAKEARKRAAM